MSVDLYAFLRARLDEDERIAKAASRGPWRVNDEDHIYIESIYDADDRSIVSGGRWGGEASVFDTNETAIHIARHDPARVLADVAAKRAILDRAVLYADEKFPDHDGGYADGMDDAVALLASAYASHPDYREEWRP